MAKIYKASDRVEVKIGDITVKIAPLTLLQKNEVQRLMLDGQKASDILKLNDSILLAIRYCLKDIQGVKDSDENDYQLEFDSNMLTENCVNDLMNMEESQNLIKVASTFIAGIPKSFDIEGVSIVSKGKKSPGT